MNKPIYNISDTVYLKTDVEQKERLVTGVLFRPNVILYYTSCGDQEISSYDFELSCDKDYTKMN